MSLRVFILIHWSLASASEAAQCLSPDEVTYPCQDLTQSSLLQLRQVSAGKTDEVGQESLEDPELDEALRDAVETSDAEDSVKTVNTVAAEEQDWYQTGRQTETSIKPKMQESGVAKGGCAPICKWSCDSPTCEQECEPICQAPRCETRCGKMNLKGCQLECEQPECATICPERKCSKKDCPVCSTKCSDPLCKLACPQKQQCKTLCETPVCKWQCKTPEKCPKPDCRLQCEKPKDDCLEDVHESIPPLKKGELKVSSFNPSPSLLQTKAASYRRINGSSSVDSRKERARFATAVVETVEGGQSLVDLPIA